MTSTGLKTRFPTRELLLYAIERVAPIEVEFLRHPDISTEQLYETASRMLVGLNLPLDEEDPSLLHVPDAPVEIARIQGHQEFFSACYLCLGTSSSLRMTVVGPTLLEPDWWHNRQAEANPHPDFTMALKKRLQERSLLPCELILRNNRERYVSNLREYVRHEREWNQLIDEMLANSYDLFGERGETGPRIKCFDPGFNHLPHIFDDIVLVGTRRSPNERVTGGWRLVGTSLVKTERERWTDLFEYGSAQDESVDQLRAFILTLREAF